MICSARAPVLASLVLAATGAAAAAPARQVLQFDVTGANRLQADGWKPYEQGFAREGDAFVCDNGADAKARRGAAQTVTLDQKEPRPIVASAWSRAEGVGGSRDADYSVYLDLQFVDGAPLWGQIAAFDAGSHDWERREVRIVPERPVKRVSVYLLLRGRAGKAWFRGAELREVEVPKGAAVFDGVPVAAGGEGGTGFLVRDVAAGSDFVRIAPGGRALGLSLEERTETKGRATVHRVRLSDTAGVERAVTLVWTMRVPAGAWRWLADPRREEPARAPRDYADCVKTAAGVDGRLGRWPLAAVARGAEGRAVAVDLGLPAVFRTGFSAAFDELYVAYDLGFVPGRAAAEVAFFEMPFDAAWGHRGAIAAYHGAVPEAFRCRTPRQGLWMPFEKISTVEGWTDFGFVFKEGDNEVPWDDAHDILTFRYTEPMTWWMKMAKGIPRTVDAALAEARRLAEKGDRSAQALLSSGFHDAKGRSAVRLLDTPWCDGAVWSMNSSPGVPGAVTDFLLKWNPALRDRLYPEGRKDGLDGEYVDSSEGYVTDELDFRRDHFAGAGAPLTFDAESRKPCLYRGLVAWEYVRGIERDVHARGRLMMANGTPHGLCWLAPLLDVMGTETDWNRGKTWQPMPDRELIWRRALCGPKPYCFLMNTVFDDFPPALVEKYMKRSLAYGMFPGFFSHNAAEGHYFSRKDLYNRDRALFKKYVPLCRRVAEAGWQPVTLARVDDPKVYVERWGRAYLTVFNDSAEKKTVTITLDGLSPAGTSDLVSGIPVVWQSGRATVMLGGEDVAVLEVSE
jgi:hypothetical protein